MFLKELFDSMGIPARIRNIMVDYVNEDGIACCVVQQTITSADIKDIEVAAGILKAMPKCRVCLIMEVFGDMELEDLEKMTNVDNPKFKKQCLFADTDLIKEYLAGKY